MSPSRCHIQRQPDEEVLILREFRWGRDPTQGWRWQNLGKMDFLVVRRCLRSRASSQWIQALRPSCQKAAVLWVLMVSQPCSFSPQPTGGQVQGRPSEPWGPFEVGASRGSSFRCLAPSWPPFPSHRASRGWYPGTLLSTLTGGPGYRDDHPLSAVSPYFTVI